MTSQQQIAEFLDQRITWPRASGPFDAEMPWDAVLVAIPSYRRPARPSTSLPKSCSPSPSSCPCSSARGSEPPTASSSPGPSRWLTPSFYRQDVELLVAALQRACVNFRLLGYEADETAAWRLGRSHTVLRVDHFASMR